MGKKAVFTALGASNHSDGIREENDYYATEPKAMKLLLEVEKFDNNVWECASGENHIADVLRNNGYKVKTSDIIKRTPTTEQIDFLKYNGTWNGDIITNPPYKYAQKFIEKALDIINDGNKIAMFLRLNFLEGKSRKELFIKYPPKFVYVSSSRLNCAKNGDFEKYTTSAIAYAWFIWEKGYNGETIIKWIN